MTVLASLLLPLANNACAVMEVDTTVIFKLVLQMPAATSHPIKHIVHHAEMLNTSLPNEDIVKDYKVNVQLTRLVFTSYSMTLRFLITLCLLPDKENVIRD